MTEKGLNRPLSFHLKLLVLGVMTEGDLKEININSKALCVNPWRSNRFLSDFFYMSGPFIDDTI